MDATELQKEDERLKALLEKAQQRCRQTQQQHAAESQQFAKTIKEKQRSISQLEHQIKLLLQKIKGSRQERVDPDQLTLFSLKELEQIAEQLQRGEADQPLIDNDLSKGRYIDQAA